MIAESWVSSSWAGGPTYASAVLATRMRLLKAKTAVLDARLNALRSKVGLLLNDLDTLETKICAEFRSPAPTAPYATNDTAAYLLDKSCTESVLKTFRFDIAEVLSARTQEANGEGANAINT